MDSLHDPARFIGTPDVDDLSQDRYGFIIRVA
jgi:hypothetical protein